MSNEVVENVKENLDTKIYETMIPRNIRLAEAPSYGIPINMYDSKSAGQRVTASLQRKSWVGKISKRKGTMAVKKGLGKGLDSLITDKVNTKPAASKNSPNAKNEVMVNINKGRTKQGTAEKKI